MNIQEGYVAVSEREIYTDSKGRQWVEDPNGTHVDWLEPSGEWLDLELGPVNAYPSDKHGLVTVDGNRTVRLSRVLLNQCTDGTTPPHHGFPPPEVDHRAALARVVRVVTGAEPDPKVLDHLMAKGARCYWVEVPR